MLVLAQLRFQLALPGLPFSSQLHNTLHGQMNCLDVGSRPSFRYLHSMHLTTLPVNMLLSGLYASAPSTQAMH